MRHLIDLYFLDLTGQALFDLLAQTLCLVDSNMFLLFFALQQV